MEIPWRFDKPSLEMARLPSYAPGTDERDRLEEELRRVKMDEIDIPLIINGEEVRTGDLVEIRCPHDHKIVLARAHFPGRKELSNAIDGALVAQREWAPLDGYQRAMVFHRAADILSGPRRFETIAAIMTNHSKTPFEAEIDLAELVDFWRFNAYYMQFIYQQQPDDGPEEVNRMDWRPLEGFVVAIPPFNFFAIGGNLPTAPALVGNVVLWKPATSVTLTNFRIMQTLMEAGLPPGVIQFTPFNVRHSELIFSNPNFAGLHFTGSYRTLALLWNKISENLERYRNFPRIVGETGGKDFVIVHPSAELEAVVANLIRGAFEYQGQKCSAASRLFAPQSLWPTLKRRLVEEISRIPMGPVDDLSVFMGALITEDAHQNVASYLEHARTHPDQYTICCGGETDVSKGWFVEPTLIEAKQPGCKLMTEEIFGPVLTAWVYPDREFEEMLKVCDQATPYALTGSVFARDRNAIAAAQEALRYAAGNFYINDKPTGAVVSRQPFGGARHSGTNDKAGSWLNLLRWLSPRTIKETKVPAVSWERPYMG